MLPRTSVEKAIEINTATKKASKKGVKGGIFRRNSLDFQQSATHSKIAMPKQTSDTAMDNRELTTPAMRANEIHRSNIKSYPLQHTHHDFQSLTTLSKASLKTFRASKINCADFWIIA